jgi:cytochrome c556
MPDRRSLKQGVVFAALSALVVVGCAGAQSMTKVGTGDVVADRQRLMKLNGASWQDAQAKAKAGNIEAIAVNAETMAVSASHIPAMFPKGSLTDKSKAKPEIWDKWADFESAAKNLETWAAKLRDTAKTKDAQATEAVMKDFGRQACGTCHTPFRVPPPRT